MDKETISMVKFKIAQIETEIGICQTLELYTEYNISLIRMKRRELEGKLIAARKDLVEEGAV